MRKNYKKIISMMSGTSADGIDAILVKIFNDLSFDVLDSHSIDYPDDIKIMIAKCANNKASTAEICNLNFVLGEMFARCANELIEKSDSKKTNIDFISSHGQTIFHSPEERTLGGITTKSTLQIGDISVIAERTGIMTVGDFRPKDIAAGGQGAPLVPFADEIIFGRAKNRGILNIGGISNITVLSNVAPTFAFDIGTGNVLIDYFAKKLFNKDFDFNGKLASQGSIDEQLLRFMMNHEYYDLPIPKTTGREMFNEEYAELVYKYALKAPYNILATVTAQCAYSIFDAYKKFIQPIVELEEIVIGGGGAYNETLKKYLRKLMPEITFTTHVDYGIDNKHKEALAFAYLGFMTVQNKHNNVPAATGASHCTCMGKISY